MGLIKEFKEFAVKGNAMDLAVGVIIGAAFGKIVTSLVEDVIMPPIGRVMGGVDFSNKYLPLAHEVPWHGPSLAEARKIGPVLAYGQFLNVLINFLIVAFCVFLIIKAINFSRRKEAAAPAPAVPPALTRQELILLEIRDALKNPAG
jgi:large conductance mechanosensitive channel